jgi:hypothetical protein
MLQQPWEKTLDRMTNPTAYGSKESPVTPDTLREVLAQIEHIMKPLPTARVARSDAALINDEHRLVADMLLHACHRGLLLFEEPLRTPDLLRADLEDIVARYRRVWLERNRPGGLEDSARRFNVLLKEYNDILDDQ